MCKCLTEKTNEFVLFMSKQRKLEASIRSSFDLCEPFIWLVCILQRLKHSMSPWGFFDQATFQTHIYSLWYCHCDHLKNSLRLQEVILSVWGKMANADSWWCWNTLKNIHLRRNLWHHSLSWSTTRQANKSLFFVRAQSRYQRLCIYIERRHRGNKTQLN